MASTNKLENKSGWGNPTAPQDFLSDPRNNEGRNEATPYVAMEMEMEEEEDAEKQKGLTKEELEALEEMRTTADISSVLTAEGIHDVPGFYVICLVILMGDMSRGVFFPSLWPFIDYLGGDQVNLGYTVAAFSFGRIVTSPIFGSMSVSYGYTNTLLISCSVLLFGLIIYSQVGNIGSPNVLILAQTCLGMGSGTLGVTRAFVADVTAKRNRTSYIAFITAVQYGGFTVTPFIGALFNRLLGENSYGSGLFKLNMYTAPAYFMMVMTTMTIVIILIFFRGRQRIVIKKETKKSHRREAIDEVANSPAFCGLTIYDCCILGCMILNVSTKGNIAAFETLGVAYAESHFNMFSSKAATIVATCGSIGVVALLSMGYVAKHMTDIQMITGGMVVMTIGIFSLIHVHEGVYNPSWEYMFAIFLVYSIGYPIGHTAVIGMFSKIIGRRPQGTLQGWFASAGSFARMAFPIMSGYVSHYRDVSTLFFILTTILLISIIFVVWNRQILSLLSS